MNTEKRSRRETAAGAAEAVASRRAEVAGLHALAGLDGFVDSIIRAVRRRTAPGPSGFMPMDSIEAFADRVRSGAGRSANIELFVERVKLGGNGVILANALLALGASVSYIGNLGAAEDPPDEGEPAARGADDRDALHHVFRPFARRCRRVVNVGPTGFTDAIEFDDGKLMLGKIAGLDRVSWDAVLGRVGGAAGLAELVGSARVFAMGNWRALPGMTRFWRGLAEEVLPRIAPERRPRIFIDLADPSERRDEDLAEGIAQLRAMNALTPVALGLNAAETVRIASIVGARHGLGSTGDPELPALHDAAAAVREKAGLDTLVCHQRRGSAAATARESASFEGPFVKKPKISTGAGDHFNAGFALASALRLPVAQRLAAGTAVSGWYIRHGEPPTFDELVGFLRELPEPERG